MTSTSRFSTSRTIGVYLFTAILAGVLGVLTYGATAEPRTMPRMEARLGRVLDTLELRDVQADNERIPTERGVSAFYAAEGEPLVVLNEQVTALLEQGWLFHQGPEEISTEPKDDGSRNVSIAAALWKDDLLLILSVWENRKTSSEGDALIYVRLEELPDDFRRVERDLIPY